MILCVEDEPTLRADVVEELRHAGYTTLEAGDGAEGLECILAHHPSLVFCDVTMPVMNGIEMFHKLRREHPQLQDIRFVFLSALDDIPSLIADGLRVDGFMTKPVNFDEILSMAKKQIGPPAARGAPIVTPGSGRVS